MSRQLGNRVFAFLRDAFSFCAVRVYKECQYLLGTGQSHDVRDAQRGDLYIRQFIDNMIEDCAGKYDPYDLECSIAMPCTIFNVNMGEISFCKAHLIGLSTLYPAGVCSLTEKDDKLYISASLGAGPLQYQCEVKLKFGGLERETTILLSSEYIKMLLSFNINRETGRNGCLLNISINELKGFKLAINGLGYLDWPLNLFLRASTTFLSMMIRNLLENELEKYILDKLPNHQFPVEGTIIKLNQWQITCNVDHDSSHESNPIKSKDFRGIDESENDTKTSIPAPLAEKMKDLCKNDLACNRELTNLFNNEREIKEKGRSKTKLKDLFHNMENNSNIRLEPTPREIAYKRTCDYLREKGPVAKASNRLHGCELKTADKPSSIKKMKKQHLDKTVAREEFANMVLDLYRGYCTTQMCENSSQTSRIVHNFVPGEKKEALDNFGNGVANCSSIENSIFGLDDCGSSRPEGNRPIGKNKVTGLEDRNFFRKAAGEIGSESRMESSGNASNSKFPIIPTTKSVQRCKSAGNKMMDLSEETCKGNVKASSLNELGNGVLEYNSDLKSASEFQLLDDETFTEASSTTSEPISRGEFIGNKSESVKFLDNQFPEESLVASNTDKLSVLLLNMINSSNYKLKDALSDTKTLPLHEKRVSSKEACSDRKSSYPKRINEQISTLNVNSSEIPLIKVGVQVPNDNGSPKMYIKSKDCNSGGDNLVQETIPKADVINRARAKSSAMPGAGRIHRSMDALLAAEKENDRREKCVEEISSKTSDKRIQSNEEGMFSAISAQESLEMCEEYTEKMKFNLYKVTENLEELKTIHVEVEERNRHFQKMLFEDKDKHVLSEVNLPSTLIGTDDSLLYQTAKFNTEKLDTVDMTKSRLHQCMEVKERSHLDTNPCFFKETAYEANSIINDGKLRKDSQKRNVRQ